MGPVEIARSTKHKILIICDSSPDAEKITSALREHAGVEFDYHLATSHATLEEAMQARTWDLILCCLVSARLSPTTTVRTVHAADPRTPLILVAGEADAKATIELMRLGASDFVEFNDPRRFGEVIQRALPVRRPAQGSTTETASEVEAALRASKENYRSLLESADAAISMVDRDGVYLYVNSIAARPFGVAPEALVGKTVHALFPSDQAEAILNDVRRVMDHGQGAILQPEVTIAGETRWFRTSIQPVNEPSGRPYAALIFASDITEQKGTELALRASEAKYRTLVESSDTSIAMFTEDGKLLFANTIAAREFGTSPEHFVGKTLAELFPPATAARHLAVIQSVIRTGVGQVTETQTVILDARRWFRTSIQPVHDAFGHTTVALMNATDITASKEADALLHHSEERFRLFMHHLPGAVFIKDAEGKTIYCNDLYAALSGKTPAEILGRRNIDYLPAEIAAPFNRENEQILADGHAREFTHRFPGPDGMSYWFTVKFSIPREHQPPILGAISLDVTKEKRAEEALRAANELLEQRVIGRTAELEKTKNRLEAIFDHSGDGILLLDIANGIQQANHAFDALFAFPPADYLGRQLSTFVQPEDAAAIEAVIQEVATAHATRRIEARARAADGTGFDVEISLAPINRTHETVTNLVCIIRDVRERKQAQRVIAEERNLLRTVIDALPDFIYVKDTQHRLVLNNLALARSVGRMTASELMGKTDYDLFPAELAAGFHADEAQLLVDGTPILNKEERTPGADGREIWAQTTKLPLRDTQGNLIGLVGITHNVTEIRAGEEALRRSEERFRQFIESAPIATIISDQNGAIVLVNRAAEHLFGYDRVALLGQPVEVLVPETIRTIHATYSSTYIREPYARRPGAMELRAQHKDGTVFPVEIQLSYVDTQPAPLVMSFLLDISVRKQAEQALQQSLAQEKEIGELKSRMVAMFSHDFRNPLMTILASSSLIRNFGARLPAEKLGLQLDRIDGAAHLLAQMLDDMLTLAMIEGGHLEFTPQPMNLVSFVGDIVTEFAAIDQGVHGFTVHDRLGHPVLADPKLLRQILSNLLANAIKYSPIGSEVTVTLAEEGSNVALIVQDQGIGIPDESLALLYEPFHRAANVHHVKGTGLGLSIVKHCVERHRGRISVASQLGQGTTFTVEVPHQAQFP